VLAILAAAAAVGVWLGSRTATAAEAAVPNEARAYFGAMTMYGRIARWAGRRALEAEAAYWEAVQR
jgi:hypothetical protein